MMEGGRRGDSGLAEGLPDEKFAALEAIYRVHEKALQPFVKEAICRPGCSFCCTHYGPLDITTLEGLAIRGRLSAFKGRQQARMQERIRRNRKLKEMGEAAVCPFLDAAQRCRIYEARPFSCRQLYSLQPCEGRGPTVHRQAAALAKETVQKIQRLDDTGYSGHLTYILALFDDRSFRRLYLAGGFDPARIESFGRSHGLVINRGVSPAGGTAEAT
ncbi:MAG: YkgJ family cysteine cluster protein [Desulfobacterales bacterium]|nr:YkgJ family cysteine cluster protein [Desulfobacterales bacterium]